MSTPAVPRVLVLFAHPAFHQSRVQRALAGAARRVEGVTFHDLYECDPDFLLDVEREQALLRAHDLIGMCSARSPDSSPTRRTGGEYRTHGQGDYGRELQSLPRRTGTVYDQRRCGWGRRQPPPAGFRRVRCEPSPRQTDGSGSHNATGRTRQNKEMIQQ